MDLRPAECPCGCNKVILEPLFGCLCSSLSAEEAASVYEALTHYKSVKDALTSLLDEATPGAADDARFELERASRCMMPVRQAPEWVKQQRELRW